MATERKIHSRAPTRIDLAGGTVDIWPIYLFLKNPTTLNLAIDLFAEAELVETKDTGVVLGSRDQGTELRLSWSDLKTAKAPPSLELHLKLFRHFAAERFGKDFSKAAGGASLFTLARSPAGAGLGGSSTLSAAMIGALATWSRGEVDPARDGESFIEVIRDTETTVIQVPAGLQDYYGAMFGGLQSLRWGVGKHARESLPISLLHEVENRVLLFYSGHSRNSGINNWALFKAFIDQQAGVRTRFQSIADATSRLEEAVRSKDWEEAARAISMEWEIRKTLADGISTPEMNAAFRAASDAGGVAWKVCGAGGGGCFFVFVPSGDAETKARVQTRVADLGIRPLPFKAVPHGLEVKVSRA